MKDLSYLNPYNEKIEREKIEEIVHSREKHWDHKGSLPYLDALEKDVSNDRELWDAVDLLIPWKKGPFTLGNKILDAEWRSDFKWERFKNAIGEIENKTVLDIGCNNGYYMFELEKLRPKLVLGIDPIPRCQAQFMFLNKILKKENLKFELLGVEHVKYFYSMFDTILFMGIIYHHRHPLEQLIDIREALAPGGEVILETIGIPGEDSVCLFPEDRYAGMKNIYFIPTLSCTVNWMKKSKFVDIEVISDTLMTPDEQRTTKWNPETFKSFQDVLDSKDQTRTVEGLPAPRRFIVKGRKKG